MAKKSKECRQCGGKAYLITEGKKVYYVCKLCKNVSQ